MTAEYAWSGFKGPAGSVAAEIRVYMNGNHEGTGTLEGDPSGGSITSTFGADTSESNNDFHVDGRLVTLKGGRTVKGSLQTSGVQSQPCFSD